jgi:hypothetical protein
VPAPWVPFTRAGCTVAAFATPGLTLQVPGADATGASGGPDARREARAPSAAQTDLSGIAIHCAAVSTLCMNASAGPDQLPDEPGGYVGYRALFGNRAVQPAISPGRPITDLDSRDIIDGLGRPGLPDAPPTASQSLGYAAAMLEAGVDVVYAAIGNARLDVARTKPFGPGEPGHVARLAADDAAFSAFISRLGAHGISRQNTLFVVVSSGTDHFVGGPPQTPGCDGIHLPCDHAPAGGVVAVIDRLLATERNNVTAFDLQQGTTPAFYIRGNPGQADPLARTLAQDVGRLSAINPVSGKSERLAAMLADRAQLQIMHMITASPARTPHVLMFGDPNYVYRTSDSHAGCAAGPACVAVDPDITWLRGDLKRPADRGWFGMAGPGVAALGLIDTPGNHADLRPTMLALLGLRDSYLHDGAVLAEIIDRNALPPQIARSRDIYRALAVAYANLNAPAGRFGHTSLALSNQAVRAGDTIYQQYLDAIDAIRIQRDALAQHMKQQLDAAAFDDRPLSAARAAASISRAETLIGEIEELAARSLGSADRPWRAANDAH